METEMEEIEKELRELFSLGDITLIRERGGVSKYTLYTNYVLCQKRDLDALLAVLGKYNMKLLDFGLWVSGRYSFYLYFSFRESD